MSTPKARDASIVPRKSRTSLKKTPATSPAEPDPESADRNSKRSSSKATPGSRTTSSSQTVGTGRSAGSWGGTRPTLHIGIDFGTTQTSVAYLKTDGRPIRAEDIKCIGHFPDAPDRRDYPSEMVPTNMFILGRRASTSEPVESDEDSEDDQQHERLRYDLLEDTEYSESEASDNDSPESHDSDEEVARHASKRRKTGTTSWARAGVSWGYRASRMQTRPDTVNYPDREMIRLLKLSLSDEDGKGRKYRKQHRYIDAQIRMLQRKGLIASRDQLLALYFTKLLAHVKRQLSKTAGGTYLDGVKLEWGVGVPVAWSSAATVVLYNAVVKAVRACGFCAEDALPDVFMVSETEAAAQFVLDQELPHRPLQAGETIMIGDGGGGTSDASTYSVKTHIGKRLRLGEEMVPPAGALVGSAMIRERFLKLTLAKLKEIEPEGDEAQHYIVATKHTDDWDFITKREIDTANPKQFRRKDAALSYAGQTIKYSSTELSRVFEPSIAGTVALLKDQLSALSRLAESRKSAKADISVSRLVLCGGFMESPALKTRIHQMLDEHRAETGEIIPPIWPQSLPATAIAKGIVMRAADKKDGPDRRAMSSFGILQHVPVEKMRNNKFKYAGWYANGVLGKAESDIRTGYTYINDTIRWVIQKGELMAPLSESKPIHLEHYFLPEETNLTCREDVYMSPNKQPVQCVPKDDERNKDAQCIARFHVDFSAHKKQFPLINTRDSRRKVHLIQYEVVMKTEDKLLRFEARWPRNAEPGKVKIREQAKVSLVPNLELGTA